MDAGVPAILEEFKYSKHLLQGQDINAEKEFS